MGNNNIPAIFNFKDHPIRVIQQGDEFWFVAKDTCEALALTNHHVYVSRLPEHQKLGVTVCDPHGREQTTMFISEAAVYKFAFRSNKKEAEEFTDWVASEVLPSIRKTGSYSRDQELQQPQPLQGDNFLARVRALFGVAPLEELELVENYVNASIALYGKVQKRKKTTPVSNRSEQKQLPAPKVQTAEAIQTDIIKHLRNHGALTRSRLHTCYMKNCDDVSLKAQLNILVALGIVRKFDTVHAPEGKYALVQSEMDIS